MIHIAICDDEEYFRLREEKPVTEYMEKRGISCRIAVYASGKEMLAAADAISYDIIFLDINMEDMDGIETARSIRQISRKVFIVFVTAYITYALEGYKVNAARYLLKEESGLENALKECLGTVTAQMDAGKKQYEINIPNGRKSIPADSLVYAESRLHKVHFFQWKRK